MNGTDTPSSKRLYRIVGIAPDGGGTVIMADMELDQANAGREAVKIDRRYVYVKVEREPEDEPFAVVETASGR